MTNYQTLIDRGICGRCMSRPVDAGFRTCTRCRELMRVQRAARRDRWRASNVCTRCGSPTNAGRRKCPSCKKLRFPYRSYGGPCVLCGFEYSDVHHRDGNHQNNDPANLVALCPNHHRLVHMGLLTL